MENNERFKEELAAQYGEVLTTNEATEKYEFISFCAPFAVVRRRSDKQKGSLQFTHQPRFYFDFTEHN